MRMCEEMTSYLNRQMTAAETIAFEKHLAVCRDCRDAVDSWRRARFRLEEMVAERTPAVDAYAAARLVDLARAQSRRHVIFWRPTLLLAAGAAFAVSVAAVLFITDEFNVAPPASEAVLSGSLPVEVLHPAKHRGEMLQGDLSPFNKGRLLARIGALHLGLDNESRVRVVHATRRTIRLELMNGRVGVSFPPSTPRATLSIRVDDLEIAVTGTEFLVEKADVDPSASNSRPVSVSVRKGAVSVTRRSDESWTIKAGHTLVIDGDGRRIHRAFDESRRAVLTALLNSSEDYPRPSEYDTADVDDGQAPLTVSRRSPKRSSQAPSLELIREWILNASYGRAEKALKQRLSSDPRDTTALSLLAICQQKWGHPEQAVKTYERLVVLGSPEERNRARFRAGVILQERLGRHDRAIAMFEAYLKERGDRRANAAEARLRMAKSFRRQGDHRRYEQVLRQIVEEHGGTEAAKQAVQALKHLN
jgi:tetratricopeptide (TPR) repeat protein